MKRFEVLRALPEGYSSVYRLTIDSREVLIKLNLYGLALWGVGYALFAGYSSLLYASHLVKGPDPLQGSRLVSILIGFFIMLSIHELIHGLAFQYFGAKPRYGFSLQKAVAYASAKGYYLTRDAYIIVGLAPLVVITIASMLLMLVFSGDTHYVIGFIGAANIGGCIGDVWFYLVCRQYPPTLLAQDYGDGAELYAPSQF